MYFYQKHEIFHATTQSIVKKNNSTTTQSIVKKNNSTIDCKNNSTTTPPFHLHPLGLLIPFFGQIDEYQLVLDHE
tara:strand:- start:89 stop:313 length:225 start_codon:yes stop_codon:yes gene_type:complete